jgi:hypothetical protein
MRKRKLLSYARGPSRVHKRNLKHIVCVSAADGQSGSKKPNNGVADCHRILLKRLKALMVGVLNGLAGAGEDGRGSHE